MGQQLNRNPRSSMNFKLEELQCNLLTKRINEKTLY